MDYLKQYKTFISSYYLDSGLRITAGVVLPAVVLSFFNLLSVGVAVALGAMCVSGADNPGPIHHRRNGMFICCLLVFIEALLTGLAAPFPVASGLLIVISCFIFSMIGVYGSRANSIGLAALLIMALYIDRVFDGWQVLIQSLYILAGGLWYTLLSLLLYNMRPYRLAQQALGECILATSDYLRNRASFYDASVNYEKAYQQMLEEQVGVHQKQDLVRELLFKTRDIVKETTQTGRTLVIIFIDMVDLFEKVMTSYQDYRELHKAFDETGILPKYQQLIIQLSQELYNIGIAVQSGNPSREDPAFTDMLKQTIEDYQQLRSDKISADNIEDFITLRNILHNIEDIAARIHTLHHYTTYEEKIPKAITTPEDYDKFVSHQEISIDLFKDNLTLQSNYFRHALRASIATIAGYIISKFLNVGHSYWILLTIIVILKPAYSLTKKRNWERLAGTIAGALLGLVILHYIKDRTVLFSLMILMMIGTYSFLRTNYMIAVIMMTPYILLLFHLLNTGPDRSIFLDRLTDTIIGSAIAFISNLFLVPLWEHEQIKEYMASAMETNAQYFRDIAAVFTGKVVPVVQYKLSRKNAFVALANLSDAFTRMLSEPKSKQRLSPLIHGFVVASHTLTSHIATLSYYSIRFGKRYVSNDFEPVINGIADEMETVKLILQEVPLDTKPDNPIPWQLIDSKTDYLMKQRGAELGQDLAMTETRKTLFEYKSISDQLHIIEGLAEDCKKISKQLGGD